MIESCPKCRKRDGWEWTWSKSFDSTGVSTCKGCGEKFK